VLREDRLGTAQADLRRARDTGRTGGVEVDVVGGITGLILGVLVTNVFVTTQGRAVVLTWASNESFGGWTKTFTDPRLCAAIVDRLTFGGTILETGTDSYRLAQATKQRTT
jgi:hypothetical protein